MSKPTCIECGTAQDLVKLKVLDYYACRPCLNRYLTEETEKIWEALKKTPEELR
jgi:hypothetical protein